MPNDGAHDGGQTRWMRHLVDGLVRGGVTDVVLSPGSRSTPILLALLRSSLPIHDVIDERAASFYALGLAREGRLPALVCTSGSAPGHYLPAVMEASAARIPLVVVSANRPPELHDTGASQTIDQSRLFGVHVRAFVDLGAPHDSERAMRAAQRRTQRAVLRATSPEPGPVHVDVGARKPLEEHDDARQIASAPAIFTARVTVNDDAIDAIARHLDDAERVLVVAGPGVLAQRAWREPIARLLHASNATLAADAGSQLRFTGLGLALDGAEAYARTNAGRALLSTDLVVQLGDFPIGPGLARLVEGRPRIVIAEGGHPDPEGDAELLAFGDVGATLDRLADRATPKRTIEPPHAALSTARAHALEGALSQPSAIHAAFGALASLASSHAGSSQAGSSHGRSRASAHDSLLGARVVLGNSLPIRAVDLYVDVDVDLGVVVQRGVSGIDGNLAGSVGVARASGRPTLAIVGDVTFLHDLGSLLLARGLEVPLVVLVLNDDGGRIFEQLPVHRTLATSQFERHFAMSHDMRFDHAAALYGLAYERATSTAEVRAAVSRGLQRAGATIVEVPLPPESARETNARFFAALERSLA
ncbi:MAG: 2-succinyl-5-enolpyruvyl-6-hydroxy-3-cyclohexene-1-carboxylic-acid synthase [Myxococcota bacterium]|jgi:2-succinyl-5-enolpyruvyl-6-hydroxy-3-cyclohexene-1-carboxylate synthase|nr:2-succinyl-5-enolpyruvyl-6-hydroxy-3-cyclohexene-1-carboxylic-acid synthase [Myxococcota bacterium]